MKLRLKYPPIPENAAKFAAGIVKAALDVSGVQLDFKPESLAAVDNIIEGMRAEGVTYEQIAETLFGFGCYVGEVFVRNNGGIWRIADETQLKEEIAGSPIVMELQDGSINNPVGKVFKRFINGDTDSLTFFYQVFTNLHKFPSK